MVHTGLHACLPADLPANAPYLICNSANVIVCASDGLLLLTGYDRDEILRQTPSIFQGPDTDAATVAQINDAVRHGKACISTIVNYTKDGVPFTSVLHIHKPQGGLCAGVHVPLSWCEKMTHPQRMLQPSTPGNNNRRRSSYWPQNWHVLMNIIKSNL